MQHIKTYWQIPILTWIWLKAINNEAIEKDYQFKTNLNRHTGDLNNKNEAGGSSI